MSNKIIAFATIICILLSAVVVHADDSLTELAANKCAESSSELSADTSADKANDGINDNADYTAWRSADDDTRPYWQTDLSIAYSISKIEIEARKDGTAQERSNFRVIVSNDSDFEKYEVVGECKEDFGLNSVWTTDVRAKDKYQYIRVEKTADGALSIGEIKIYAKTSTIYYGTDTPSANTQQPLTDLETRYQIPKDVVGIDEEDEIYFLSVLNIMRGYADGTFQPDSYITRAEFATVAAKMLDFSMYSSKNTFTDVAENHWAYAYIQSCYDLKLIDGIGGGLFAPDDEVTFNQAVKIIVSALGYDGIAKQRGGYPNGYLSVASSLRILDGVSSDEGRITRADIAQLCYNSLFAELFTVLDVDKSKNFDAGETLLSKVFHLYKTDGVVTEVNGTSLTDSNILTVDENYIKINGIRLKTDYPDFRTWLGYDVDVYYRKTEGAYDEAVIVIPPKNIKTMELDADDIISFDNSYALHYYDDNNKSRKLKFKADLDVIYNGKAKLNYDNASLIPDFGYVTAIDNDNNGTYDVMIIRHIQTGVANFADADENIIYLKNSIASTKTGSSAFIKENTIKWNDEDPVTIHDVNGKQIQLGDIKEWNILSIEKSDNDSGETAIDICVSDAFVRGEVTSKDKETVTIKNKEYKLGKNLISDGGIDLRDKGIFYLDCYGNIAAFDGDNTGVGKYGFLTYVDEGSFNKISIRIFTSNGEVEVFPASSKLKVNGKAISNITELENILKNTEWGKDLTSPVWNGVSQIVRYSVNSKGEVYSMYTYLPEDNADYTENNLNRSFESASRGYLSSTGVFGMRLMLSDDAFIVRCSDDWSESGYELVAKSSIESGVTHTFEAYDANTVNVADAAVFLPGIGLAPSENAVIALVDEIHYGLNEDGDEVNILLCWYKGELVKYSEAEYGKIAPLDLKRGDIVAFSLDSKNEIKSIARKFYPDDYAYPEGESAAKANFNVGKKYAGCISKLWPIEKNKDTSYNSCLYYGIITARDGNIIKIKANVDDDYEWTHKTQEPFSEIIANLSNIKAAYVYDSDSDKIRLATSADFLDSEYCGEGSKVVCQIGSSALLYVVIFK